jgi:hypothetical protein
MPILIKGHLASKSLNVADLDDEQVLVVGTTVGDRT